MNRWRFPKGFIEKIASRQGSVLLGPYKEDSAGVRCSELGKETPATQGDHDWGWGWTGSERLSSSKNVVEVPRLKPRKSKSYIELGWGADTPQAPYTATL